MFDDFWKKRTELDSLPLRERLEIMDAIRRRARKRTWAIRWGSGSSFWWPLFVIVVWGTELQPWMIVAGFILLLIVGAWEFVVDMIEIKQMAAIMEKVYEEEFAGELRRRGLTKEPPAAA